MARAALAAVGTSVTLMVVAGAGGPSPGVGVRAFSPAPPWPPWFVHASASAVAGSAILWLAVVLGGVGLAAGLVAARRGWRPRPRLLVLGSVVAVVALMVIPPVGSNDMLVYVAAGRIAVLGHDPYVMTPGQLTASGDPVGTGTVFTYPHAPSPYGPVATGTEAVASELGGTSVARTLFWLKVWDALAYLALVFALDRMVRSDAARRVRAHLLWSVNPLMLFEMMASGHNDVLAAAAGLAALLAMHRVGSPWVGSRRALLAGGLLGLAAAIKAPYVLFGAGLAWCARRSPAALAALALGMAAVLVPGYVWAGPAAIPATTGVAARPVGPSPWALPVLMLQKVLRWHISNARIDTVALIGSAVLVAVLLSRMPPGSRDLPAVRVALAAALALLVLSPQQQPWYAALVFPLLALFPASRLDWIAVALVSATAMGELPVVFLTGLHPAWLARLALTGELGIVLLGITEAGCTLLWLCLTQDWRPVTDLGTPVQAVPGGLDAGIASRN
jgi:Glycosyltransferase family 87